jgi:hypothetical protein
MDVDTYKEFQKFQSRLGSIEHRLHGIERVLGAIFEAVQTLTDKEDSMTKQVKDEFDVIVNKVAAQSTVVNSVVAMLVAFKQQVADLKVDPSPEAIAALEKQLDDNTATLAAAVATGTDAAAETPAPVVAAPAPSDVVAVDPGLVDVATTAVEEHAAVDAATGTDGAGASTTAEE